MTIPRSLLLLMAVTLMAAIMAIMAGPALTKGPPTYTCTNTEIGQDETNVHPKLKRSFTVKGYQCEKATS